MTKIIIRKKRESNMENIESDAASCKNTVLKSIQKPDEISINNYSLLLCNDYDYKVIELKKMCKIIQKECGYKKMKTTGTKFEMKQNIYNFYNHTFHSIKIQLKFKSYLRRKLAILRGPALKNRGICINDTDFYTLDPIRDIPDTQFFSYEEKCGVKMCCYGFDMASIFNLILNDNLVDNIANLNRRLSWTTYKESSNPYNRSVIPPDITQNILKIIKLDSMLNGKKKESGKKHKNNFVLNGDQGTNNGNIVIELPQDVLTPQQRYRQNVLQLFQTINSLGHYSDPDWFMVLTYQQHITFLRELIDIWNYRAELSYSARVAIYPPNGNPFPQDIMGWLTHQFYSYLTMENIININMTIIERLTITAVLESDRCLGANFVLCALTLVSVPAREALPWLYQSVMYA
jgi:hypothetical protein